VLWRRESPVGSIPDVADFGDFADRHAVGALVRSALATLPQALYEVLSMIPGVTVQGEYTDSLGRTSRRVASRYLRHCQ
jgi:hypothetical protein